MEALSKEQLQALSQIVNRATLAARLGKQYGGDRNVYQALGYPTEINYEDYSVRYERQDMAKAVIDRPVKFTWLGALNIIESEDDKETIFEKNWDELNDTLRLKSIFMRLDRLSGIGEYGVLLLGLDDVKNSEQFEQPLTKGRKLVYVKPLGQGSAEIKGYEKDTKDPRYGLPVMYQVKISNDDGSGEKEVLVHHTRVIHVVDDILEGEVKGMPRLQAVFNRLMDLEKLVGGDAEMFWRGARPGYQGVVDKEHQMTAETEAALKDQIDEYEHNLRRLLVNEGVDLKALAQQIADPKNHVDIQIQMVSAVTGIPKRMLIGSERGELSSAQDRDEMMTYIQSRREDFAESRIIRPFVDWCIEYGVLPKPSTGKYTVDWFDLFAMSEKDRVDIGKVRSTALKEYTANPMAEMVVPPDAFMRFFLGLKDEEIELIEEFREAQVIEEPIVEPGEEEIIEEE